MLIKWSLAHTWHVVIDYLLYSRQVVSEVAETEVAEAEVFARAGSTLWAMEELVCKILAFVLLLDQGCIWCRLKRSRGFEASWWQTGEWAYAYGLQYLWEAWRCGRWLAEGRMVNWGSRWDRGEQRCGCSVGVSRKKVEAKTERKEACKKLKQLLPV